MTDTQLRALPAYGDTRNAIAEIMGITGRLRMTKPYSSDEASDYQQLSAVLNKSARQLRALAMLSLQELDQQVANSTLVGDLNEAAKDAINEAERIAEAAATVDKIIKVLDEITGLVTKISGLPFLAPG